MRQGLARGEALGRQAIDVFSGHTPALLASVAVVIIPARLVLSFFLAIPGQNSAGWVSFLRFAVSTPLSLAIGVLASAACMHTIGEAYVGRRSDWRASLRFMSSRIGPVLGVTAIFAVGVSIGFMLLFIPGVFLGVVWSLAVPVVLLESVSVKKALRRSVKLVTREWQWVAAVLAAGFIATGLVKLVISLIAWLLSLGASSGFSSRFVRIFVGDVAGDLLTTPVIAVADVLLYFQIRGRYENLAPEHIASSVDTGGPDRVATLRQPIERARRLATRLRDDIRRYRAVDPLAGMSTAYGPIAIVFTDMEGSTELTRSLGDASAREVLREHDRILRASLGRHDGREVKHLGDGIMACFSSTTQAVGCAVDIEKAFSARNESNGDIPIRVRIGINAGEPLVEDGDIFGGAVQMAARIVNEAKPTQILVSEAVRQLAIGHGFTFVSQGPVTLRGFDEPFSLYEVDWTAPPQPGDILRSEPTG